MRATKPKPEFATGTPPLKRLSGPRRSDGNDWSFSGAPGCKTVRTARASLAFIGLNLMHLGREQQVAQATTVITASRQRAHRATINVSERLSDWAVMIAMRAHFAGGI